METSTPRNGGYGKWELPALLRGYVRHLCDGRLETTVDGVTRSIWLDAGQIRAVVSQVVEERLGDWLTGRGVLTPAQIEATLAKVQEGALFGTVLVAEGFLELDRLQQELEARVVGILARLLPSAGMFRFFAGERFPFESLELTQSSASFLVAAAREIQDLATLAGTLDENGFLRTTKDPAVAFQNVRLLPHEAFLFSRIDGFSSLATLRRVVPLPQETLTRAAVALWAGGFVEVWEKPTQGNHQPVLALAAVESPRAPEPPAAATEYSPLQRKEREEILRLAAEIRFQSHYRRLGVETTATSEEIRRAFAGLARRFHPDRTSEPHLRFLRRELAEVYHCVEEAVEVTLDPARRLAYDKRLKEKRMVTDDPFESELSRAQACREIVVANIRKAEELTRLGDSGGAVTLLEQAVRFDPQPNTLVALARLQLKNPMWVNRALDHLRHAVAVNPKCSDAWLEMARFWARRSQSARSRECLDKVLAYDPGNAEATEILHTIKAR